MRIGYARVSTCDQHAEVQADALTGAGCERIYADKASGKLARRPELDEALRGLRAGDQLVVTKVDRLGRSYGPGDVRGRGADRRPDRRRLAGCTPVYPAVTREGVSDIP